MLLSVHILYIFGPMSESVARVNSQRGSFHSRVSRGIFGARD